MKKDIHPLYQDCVVKCACGNSFVTRSTMKEILVEVCFACHPVYTGKQKIIDSTGRVDRFKKMMDKKDAIQKELKKKAAAKKKKEKEAKNKKTKNEVEKVKEEDKKENKREK